MTGLVIPWLGYSLMALAVLLLLIPAWPYLKKGNKSKMILGLGVVLVIGGLVIILTQIDFRTKTTDEVTTHIKLPDTAVYCCIGSRAYQLLVENKGVDKDVVFVTLMVDGQISGIKALMGASSPTILEGGVNANFITFKTGELLPGMSLGYLIDVNWTAAKPIKFTAWSDMTKGNLSTKFTGQCPSITSIGPEKTAPR